MKPNKRVVNSDTTSRTSVPEDEKLSGDSLGRAHTIRTSQLFFLQKRRGKPEREIKMSSFQLEK